jgi:beta-galactosidase GanA
MLTESSLRPDVFAVPEGVEVYRRVAADRKVFIVDNLSRVAQTIVLPDGIKDALTDQIVHSVKLPPYGVAVLLQAKARTPDK